MFPLHAGHPVSEVGFIVLLAIILGGLLFVCSRGGWGRVGVFAVAAFLGGVVSWGLVVTGVGVFGYSHLLVHGLELASVLFVVLTGVSLVSQVVEASTES